MFPSIILTSLDEMVKVTVTGKSGRLTSDGQIANSRYEALIRVGEAQVA